MLSGVAVGPKLRIFIGFDHTSEGLSFKTDDFRVNKSNDSQRMNFLEGLLFLIALMIPIGFFFLYPSIPVNGDPLPTEPPVAVFEDSPLSFERKQLMPEPQFGQMYTNVTLIDSESGDGKDILATDARTSHVVQLKRAEDGSWTTTILNQDKELPAPAHVTPVDLDNDGDQDYLVSCIGGIQPTNDLVGRVVWLENNDGQFTSRDILTGVRRVTDAQCADFDSDGDMDIVVAVFGGLLQGQVLWLENDGKQNFTDHELMAASGPIHVPVADFDGDGDSDFAVLISQEDEEVWIFENLGDGLNNAKRHLIFQSWNFDLGTAGMEVVDLDQDGDLDFLLAIGDNLELINNAAQPWHGVKWLENKGDWKFEDKQIATIGGVYGVSPADLDNDGDLDVAVTTIFNDWTQENAASVLWLENDGKQGFKTWQIASKPIQLATVATGDVNQDGKTDIITGSFHFRKPNRDFGSIDVFLNQSGAKQ